MMSMDTDNNHKQKEIHMEQTGKAGHSALTPAKVHAFAHLGQAPYTYVGYRHLTYQACHGAPIQVGGSCDHCMTGIMDAYYFRSADGKEFKVGSTCVAKAGDQGLKKAINADVAKIRRERKALRDKHRIEAAMASYGHYIGHFANTPHPYGFKNRETNEPMTFCDWVDWMMDNSGTAGKLKVAKVIEAEIKELTNA